MILTRNLAEHVQVKRTYAEQITSPAQPPNSTYPLLLAPQVLAMQKISITIKRSRTWTARRRRIMCKVSTTSRTFPSVNTGNIKKAIF